MIVIVVKFLLPALLLFYLLQRILGKNESKSKSTLVLLLVSLIFNTALAQNYNYSLIPYPERDGYSISNWLAYYVFGEDHFGHWNSDLFKAGYEISIYVSIILLVIYVAFLIIEHKKYAKSKPL
jgi:ABC-type dipeptide/oligopeptide/nickel transport system permease subunit